MILALLCPVQSNDSTGLGYWKSLRKTVRHVLASYLIHKVKGNYLTISHSLYLITEKTDTFTSLHYYLTADFN